MERMRQRTNSRMIGLALAFCMMAGIAVGQPPQKERTLADILLGNTDRKMLRASTQNQGELSPPPNHDVERLKSMGFRQLTGTHLELWTDLPSALMVDQLPLAFDLAVEQWAAYFGAYRRRRIRIGGWSDI